MSTEQTRHVIFDTDPGMGLPYADLDDNLAMLFLAGSPEITVDLVTVVEGNVRAHHGYQSILHTLEFLKDPPPVSMGSQRPLMRPYAAGQDVIGSMGAIEFRGTFSPSDQVPEPDGLCRMAAAIADAPAPVTILAVGPLTNVALLLHQRPDLHAKIQSIVIMGGAVRGPGNVSPFAEFNIWVDPEAAQMVFESPVPKVMMGLGVTTTVALTTEHFAPLLKETSGTAFGEDLRASLDGWLEAVANMSGAEAFNPHDPIAAAWLVKPDLFAGDQMDVTVDTRTGQTRGRPDARGSTWVTSSVDVPGFISLFFERLGQVALR